MKNFKLIIITITTIFSVTNLIAMEERGPRAVEIPTRRAPRHVFYSWEPTEYEMARVLGDMEAQAKQQKKLQERTELRKRRTREAIAMKPLMKTTGIAALNNLLLQDSDEARNAELNKLPREVKEYLIPVIDDRKQLLDINELDEAAMINDLDLLQKQIQANLAQ